ncbi:hypothetical protein IHE55_19195 [Streptomyces pactum]|uniref:Uncharacterized protein n=1 Tax=Streptomyces pactum TaxID=68249 RepID=A0ABS0NNK0_9ACTN|nr:hypothetical protein [Streptomyces pactum]
MPASGISTCRTGCGASARRRTQNQPITEACSSVNAVSAPMSTTDTSRSRPLSRRAAHTAATSVTTAESSTARRGTPLGASTVASTFGSRRSRAIAKTSRPAAACPASAANAAPIALLTATRSCSQVPTAESTAS